MGNPFRAAAAASAAAALVLVATALSPVAALRQASGNSVGVHIDQADVRDAVSSHIMPMRAHIPSARAPDYSSPHLRRRGDVSANLTNVHDIYYIVDIKVGRETIPVSVDTGSSDTWLVQQPYQCVSYYWEPGKKPDCGLGAGLKGNLSGGLVPDVVFGRAYGDGTFVQGYFGYEDVTVGGLTAHHQRLAIVNYTYWYGDNRVSGLLGLAYPLLTSLDGGEQTKEPYDPIFFTMWKNKLVAEPIFSIALSRDEDQTTVAGSKAPITNGGQKETSYLALGGLPPVSYDNSTWARTPIQSMDLIDGWAVATKELGMYIIVADAYVFGKTAHSSNATNAMVPEPTRNTTRFPVLIDAGSTLSILPTEMVTQLYKSFDPPARYMPGTGLYFAPCNATVPTFGVQIGTQTFYIQPEDLLRQSTRKEDDEGVWCRIGVTDSDYSPWVLGVTFLSNVVAVFDVGLNEMRFATRTKY
ncbi:aspartic peptidase domain-containing protein [Apodospora peruviana]|uniref:Aspartic peptidase domain-containing protein n=1 Tax=Apodospora peruviana TaxID=516989 RepID=A0AAE0M2Q1_9PEZI|nr:aspartic peptidase domain-containing protein [Apodospora peruviana]